MAEIVDFLRHSGIFFGNIPAFFVDVPGISLLKLRASIGNPGNQNFDDYISTRVYTYNTDNMNIFGASAIVSNLGNKGLEWQKTLDRNIGFDVIFIDNRLRINFDYFNSFLGNNK